MAAKSCVIDHLTYKIGVHGLSYVWSPEIREWVRTAKSALEIKSVLRGKPLKIRFKKRDSTIVMAG